MSLQIWLPLTEDLHNQGLLGNMTFSSANSELISGGIIGQNSYNFNGTSSRIYANSTYPTPLTNIMSLTCWAKLDSTATQNGYLCGLGKNNAAFMLMHYNKTSIICYYGGSSQITYNVTDYLDSWHHYAYISDGNKIFLYIDGILKVEKNFSGGSLGEEQCFSIGARNAGAIGTGAVFLKGQINDVRFYDHALSAKEVEEIAKGLVLHYKLDDRFCEPTTNLCNNLKAGGRTTLSTNPLMITTTGENADTYWYVQTSSALVGGNTYTLSLQCSGLAPGEYFQFGIGALSGANSCGQFVIYNGYNEKTFTLASGLDGVKQFILDDSSSSTNVRSKRISFYNVQLEEKDHATGYAGPGGSRAATIIYDSSGYNNNGTIVGSLATATPSPRYSCATKFDGNTTINPVPSFNVSGNLISEFSFTGWVNRTGQSTSSVTIYGGPIWAYTKADETTLYVTWYHAKADKSYTQNNWSTGLSFPLNTWIHIAIVFKDGIITLYKNGTYLKKTDRSDNGQYIRGNRGFTIGNSLQAQLSDFRVYSTALSADQVKEIYNTSMAIDNNGNIYARELVE